MAKPPRSWLRKNIDKLLVPALEQRGFARVRLSGDWARSEMKFLTPHGSFRRPGPQGLETIEIHFGRYGTAVFSLDFGILPPSGLSYSHAGGSGHIAQEDMCTGWLDVSYSLLAFPRLFLGFRVWRWPGRTVVESDYEKLVSKVVDLIPEIEVVFKGGRCGPHVRMFDRRFRPNRLQRLLIRLSEKRSGS